MSMNPPQKMSDEEVSFAIRYLDPDLADDLEQTEVRLKNRKYERRAGITLLILSIGFSMYATVLRFLPAVMRLFN
ncbi:MAG TPA: hypothetical protein VF532_14000 [Candidatus Angelobacter sp.]